MFSQIGVVGGGGGGVLDHLPSHLSYVSSMRCNDWFCFLSAVLLVIFGLYEWVYTTQQIITGESEEPCQHTAWSPGHNQAVLTTLVISTSPSPLPPPQTLQLWATSSKIIYLAASPPDPAQPVTCRPGWMYWQLFLLLINNDWKIEFYVENFVWIEVYCWKKRPFLAELWLLCITRETFVNKVIFWRYRGNVLRLDKMMIVHTSNILYEYCQPGGKSKGRKTDLNTMAGDFLVRPVLEVFKLVINHWIS